jgi:hypothetical protein
VTTGPSPTSAVESERVGRMADGCDEVRDRVLLEEANVPYGEKEKESV